MKLITAQRNKIIAESLDVSVVYVRQIMAGSRGKWDTEQQQKVLKAKEKADEIYEKANIKIVQYCRSLKMEQSPLTPDGGTAGASYIRVMKKCVN